MLQCFVLQEATLTDVAWGGWEGLNVMSDLDLER